MAKIPRWFQKIFAVDAVNNGVFGSAADGTKVLTDSLATIQSKPAYSNGWLDAVIGAKKFPPLEEFQSLHYMTTTQLAYLFENGIPEYDSQTTYYQNSIVRKTGTYELYGSITDNNVGNALPNATSDANWQFLQDLSLQNAVPYGVAAGTNTYTVTTNPVVNALFTGMLVLVKFANANTGAATINVNSTTDVPIVLDAAALQGSEIASGAAYALIYDGTSFNLVGAHPVYSTDIQTQTGTSTNVAVTPASLSSRTATETRTGLIELATSAEVRAGSDTQRAITPSGLASGIGFTRFYDSGQVPVPTTTTNFAHGLGTLPIFVVYQLICVDPDGGYSVGDVVLVDNDSVPNFGGRTAGFNNTNVFFTAGNGTGIAIVMQNKSGTANFAVTNSRWRLRVIAWA